MNKPRTAESGLTVMELMVAIFIFSFVSLSLIYGLRGGDRISGRAKSAAAAASLASSEAEKIRHDALLGTQSPDISYTETVSGVRYTVTRKTVTDPNTVLESRTYTEFEIRVDPPNALHPPHTFKLVQGYHQ